MRMWLCDPEIMCQKHLCGEHLEMHMFFGSLKKRKKIDGYLKNNLFEPRSLYQRHKDLADEMIKRDYNHKTPMIEEECATIFDLPIQYQYWEVNRKKSFDDLIDRCPECRKRYEEKSNGNIKE